MTVESYQQLSGALPRTSGVPARVQEQRAPVRAGAAERGGEHRGTNAALLALGRAIFGGYFVYNGVNHFANAEMMSGYAGSKGVPMPGAAVALTGAMLLAGGLSLLAGTRPKIGSALIGAFLLGVSPAMHRFWDIEDPQQRMQELVNFTKNMGLLGGALIAAAAPEPWPVSIDRALGAGSRG